jgi:hypothetical protein
VGHVCRVYCSGMKTTALLRTFGSWTHGIGMSALAGYGTLSVSLGASSMEDFKKCLFQGVDRTIPSCTRPALDQRADLKCTLI